MRLTVISSGPISYAEAKELAFLGTLSLLTLDDHGRPLHLGRKVRLATSDQWIAGSIWHRECVIPGCDRPAQWCHAHHHTYWTHGGTTDLENLPFVAPSTTGSSTTGTGRSTSSPTAPGGSPAPTAPPSNPSATPATTDHEPDHPPQPELSEAT